MTYLLLALICLTTAVSSQEPGTIPWTPKKTVETSRVSIEVPARFSSVGLNPNVHQLSIPVGWTAKIFYAGTPLSKPRFMSWGPDSVLFVANMNGNSILALPDSDRDGIADTAIVAARGFSYGHDVRFYRDTMFVCQEGGVVKLWRSNGTGYVFDQRQIVIDKSMQTNQTGGNHRTRTLVIDSIRNKLYVSVGSRGNADRESNRAVIEEYEYDGTGRRVYSSGVRNAVGMTLHPRTGALWANNNGSDNQGNDVPPEWIDIVRDGGFYGYPFAYHFRRLFNFTGDYSDLLPITPADSATLNTMVPPAALVDAHCAPMALVISEPHMPTQFRSGAFMAMRGSWNRQPLSGAKVVYFDFDNDLDTIANSVQDFCSGFITDTNSQDTRWARPVGLALGSDGSVYVSSDDIKQFILKLTPPVSTSVDESQDQSLRLTPHPAGDRTALSNLNPGADVRLYNSEGYLVHEFISTSTIEWINTSRLATGSYRVVVSFNGVSSSFPLIVIH